MVSSRRESNKIFIKLAIFYWALVILIYGISFNQFKQTTVSTGSLSPIAVVGNIYDGIELTQKITIPADELVSIDIRSATFGRTNNGNVCFSLYDSNSNLISSKTVPVSDLPDNSYYSIVFEDAVKGYRSEKVLLRISTDGVTEENAISFYFGTSIVSGRFDVVKAIPSDDLFILNGIAGTGMLCIRTNAIYYSSFYIYYWIIVACLFLALFIICYISCKRADNGARNIASVLRKLSTRYRFLIKQLVSRDFKTKYKRSVLGVAWSFLNPLLTMAVQYLVFSRLFRSDIPNYPVYLLTGIVLFNFFNEAVSMGLSSITDNAFLINKVYMPKYVYPITRVLSSLINFALAFIPLLLVMIWTRTPIRLSIFLLVFDFLCLTMFILGMVLLLSSLMVFFRDTRFLWSVLSMIWMYATPIFYPEAIIPDRLLVFYHMNPMYQYITFARIVLIDGISPAPTAYLWCLLSSVVVLIFGGIVFQKNQDKFVLYL